MLSRWLWCVRIHVRCLCRSSKKPVSKFRKVVSNLAAPSRDPRFDDLSGTFNEDMFRKSYYFVDEQRGAELKTAMAELKKTKDEDRREQLIKLVQRMKEQGKAQKEKDARKVSELHLAVMLLSTTASLARACMRVQRLQAIGVRV